jgi:hypothetical protein
LDIVEELLESTLDKFRGNLVECHRGLTDMAKAFGALRGAFNSERPPVSQSGQDSHPVYVYAAPLLHKFTSVSLSSKFASISVNAMLHFLLTLAEALVLLLVVLSCGMALIYYGISFVEEHMRSFIIYLKSQSIAILSIATLFPVTSFSLPVFITVLLSNGLWTFLLFRGFPFLSLDRPDFYLAIISSVLAHFFMTLHFLSRDAATLMVAAYFLMFVWLLPIGMIISFGAATETVGENSPVKDQKEDGPVRGALARLLKRAEDSLPTTTPKCE